MANSVDPDQIAPIGAVYIGAVCSWSTLFASILKLSGMLGNYLQQMTSADDIFRFIFFLGALSINRSENGHFFQFLCFFRALDKLLIHIGHMKQVHMIFS